MTDLGTWLMGLGIVGVLYPYVIYPAALKIIGEARSRPPWEADETETKEDWPYVSICVPAYNEEHQIAETIETLLALEYPADRLQIVIVSDASEDRTDDIVRSFAGRGVQLIRNPERGGKTAAENAVAPLLRGEIVINTDASIRIHRHAVKALVAPFADSTVGVASGRDVSVGGRNGEANQGEAGYVGYEMWVRHLETQAWGIVGASGSLYAIRSELHGIPLPPSLSRDFAAALTARERGYRAISVSSATCTVPRAESLSVEYRRKVRTMTRGMETLIFKKELLNPFRYGLFSWMLLSHKICRWLAPWAVVLALSGVALLGREVTWGRNVAAGALALTAVVALLWGVGRHRPLPRLAAVPSFLLMANVAALHASIRALLGDRSSTWEPTRRSPTAEP